LTVRDAERHRPESDPGDAGCEVTNDWPNDLNIWKSFDSVFTAYRTGKFSGTGIVLGDVK
jgi:hypothetical protein